MKYFLYYFFRFTAKLGEKYLFLYYFFCRNKKEKNGILALPYYPSNWPGGEERIAAWREYFINDTIDFTVHFCWEKKDIERFFVYTKSSVFIGQYAVYFKILYKRLHQLSKLSKYQSIWIQRAAIPLFPFKDAYFEKLLAKFHKNIIYDFYDADYESNYNLVINTVKYGNKITVASQFLLQKFANYNLNVHLVRFAIPFNENCEKTNQKNQIKIGWMGSPENAKQLLAIDKVLFELQNKHPEVVFSFVCRELPELSFIVDEKLSWSTIGFDYQKWLKTIDIGMVPFFTLNDRTKAKIAMKSLEFMANEIPFVTSPYIHSDKLVNHESVLVAVSLVEWKKYLEELIISSEKRVELRQKAKTVFLNYHSYEIIYQQLKTILLS